MGRSFHFQSPMHSDFVIILNIFIKHRRKLGGRIVNVIINRFFFQSIEKRLTNRIVIWITRRRKRLPTLQLFQMSTKGKCSILYTLITMKKKIFRPSSLFKRFVECIYLSMVSEIPYDKTLLENKSITTQTNIYCSCTFTYVISLTQDTLGASG